MKFSKSSFEECNEKKLNEINGGLLVGGIAGGILGSTVGLAVGTVASIKNGDYSGKTIYKTTVAFGLTGAAIGTYTPI